jgi:hypothetical protein
MPTRKGLLYAALTCAASILFGFALVAMVMSYGCQTLSVSQSSCDKIAYYESYLKEAEAWIPVVALIPGTQQYVAAASGALAMIDAGLVQAVTLCGNLASGKSTMSQINDVLQAIYTDVNNFNQLAGQIQAVVKK